MIVRLAASSQERADAIAAVLAPLGLRVMAKVIEAPARPTPARSVAAAARARALQAAEASGGVVVLDDEALVVPALGGQPGQASSRFADSAPGTDTLVPDGIDHDERDVRNVARLLELMAGVALHGRAAVLLTHVVVAAPRRLLFEAPAECHGWLLGSPRGVGRGYDPIVVAQAAPDRSLAELSVPARARATGRARALDDLLMWAMRRGGAL